MFRRLASVLLISSSVFAAGLYPKNSHVIQVDGSNYEKLIGKSNYTSILEFYAPWCGHCQNLKPAYEKVATALSGVAKVAAVNCDEDSNKPFCGGFGIKGFPTLKIVKPSKKRGGKPLIEEYQGQRTAKAIHEILTDKIPNHVSRPKDGEIDDWLKKSAKPKALFFTDKRVVGSMVKALAIDFLDAVDVAQIGATQKEVVTKFNVNQFPSLYVIQGDDASAEKYDGEMKKQPLKAFISKYATPNPEFPSSQSKEKPATAKKDKKPAGKDKTASGEASCPMGHTGKNPHVATSETGTVNNEEARETPDVAGNDNDEKPSEPPRPAGETPPPPPSMESLDTEEALKKLCLNTRVGTCLLALLPSAIADDKSSLDGLKDIAQKHAARRMKLFPFYTVPSSNAAGQSLLSKLGTDFDKEGNPLVLVLNLKKNWWNKYSGTSMALEHVENWIDNIRFGDFKKTKLTEGVAESIIGSSGDTPKSDTSKDEL